MSKSGSGRAIARAAWFVIVIVILCLFLVGAAVRGAIWLGQHLQIK
jgi:hypothetical protein